MAATAPSTAPPSMATRETTKVAPARPKQAALQLRLYVAGNAANSVSAIANAKAICDEHFASAYELEIVDMLEDPRRALADGIVVTPTLLKLSPLPVQRAVGNLSDTKQVLLALGNL
jgi:circadian clock protein KaiB